MSFFFFVCVCGRLLRDTTLLVRAVEAEANSSSTKSHNYKERQSHYSGGNSPDAFLIFRLIIKKKKGLEPNIIMTTPHTHTHTHTHRHTQRKQTFHYSGETFERASTGQPVQVKWQSWHFRALSKRAFTVRLTEPRTWPHCTAKTSSNLLCGGIAALLSLPLSLSPSLYSDSLTWGLVRHDWKVKTLSIYLLLHCQYGSVDWLPLG